MQATSIAEATLGIFGTSCNLQRIRPAKSLPDFCSLIQSNWLYPFSSMTFPGRFFGGCIAELCMPDTAFIILATYQYCSVMSCPLLLLPPLFPFSFLLSDRQSTEARPSRWGKVSSHNSLSCWRLITWGCVYSVRQLYVSISAARQAGRNGKNFWGNCTATTSSFHLVIGRRCNLLGRHSSTSSRGVWDCCFCYKRVLQNEED